jgi:hypothetical protein
MAVALVAVSAVAIDFSRLWALRNELQTSADAGAHAGAIQLLPPNNAGQTATTAQGYALLNPAMGAAVTVDSVQLGNWDDVAKTFTPGAATTNAVNVVVSRQSSGLMMSVVGVTAPRLKARAIGWADAPVVANAGCMRPWAVPYPILMASLYRKRYCPGNPNCNVPIDSLTRAWDNVNDVNTLNSMTAAERTFSLKLAAPGGGRGGRGGGGGVDSVTPTYMPGNFQAVQLPEVWDAGTQSYTSPAPATGANAYRNHVAGAGCPRLDVGDSLQTEPGNMTGPTVQGATGQHPSQGPGICATLSAAGDCRDANNAHPSVMAPFYVCRTGCQGRTRVGVVLLGSFTLTTVVPSGPNMASIVGILNTMNTGGSIGAGGTTLVRPILVK